MRFPTLPITNCKCLPGAWALTRSRPVHIYLPLARIMYTRTQHRTPMTAGRYLSLSTVRIRCPSWERDHEVPLGMRSQGRSRGPRGYLLETWNSVVSKDFVLPPFITSSNNNGRTIVNRVWFVRIVTSAIRRFVKMVFARTKNDIIIIWLMCIYDLW